jgi:hypothetical protein
MLRRNRLTPRPSGRLRRRLTQALELMSSTQKSQSLSTLSEALEELLASRIGVVEASRIVTSSRFALGQQNNPLFIPFVGIDSETDQFPLGQVRELWSRDALVRYDQEREAAEQHYTAWAMQSAKALLAWAHSQEF